LKTAINTLLSFIKYRPARHRILRDSGSLLALIVGFSLGAYSQAPAGATGIAGTVTDQSGAVFPGVTVTVLGAAAAPQTVVTSERGEYLVA
jgi:hypothetical protein